jgi:hypothetical protein
MMLNQMLSIPKLPIGISTFLMLLRPQKRATLWLTRFRRDGPKTIILAGLERWADISVRCRLRKFL